MLISWVNPLFNPRFQCIDGAIFSIAKTVSSLTRPGICQAWSGSTMVRAWILGSKMRTRLGSPRTHSLWL